MTQNEKSKETNSQSPGRDYKETLFLPKTEFPMRAGLPQKEPEWIKTWEDQTIYQTLRMQSKERPLYVLHDGPPYANGHIHMGTALNKILKDIVVRSHQMMGYNAPYIPGWDCHGLPIEWKVEEKYRQKGIKKEDVSVKEFRSECRAFAQKWLDIQCEEFRRLGISGDWYSPYNTMDYKSESIIVREFLKCVEKDLVYRGSKPVMWSPVEQTALAEAEIEYHDHASTQIWVRFPIIESPVLDDIEHTHPPSIVIWTTTPWTIPGNRAIAYSDKISYGLYEIKTLKKADFEPWVKIGDQLIIADSLWEKVAHACQIDKADRIKTISSELLSQTVLAHPLSGKGYEFNVPMLKGDHVTEDTGTGFVHIAPGHGQEDYDLWRKYGYTEIPELIDEKGCYYDHVPLFSGEKILITEGKKSGKDASANRAVIAELLRSDRLLSRAIFEHSYPHSWRSKAPVIFRNTPQWFIRMDNHQGESLREKALKSIDQVNWFPKNGRNRIHSMVEDRPDWLISRQRAWGVPLTIFVHKKTKEILKDTSVNERIIKSIEAEGADVWFEKDNFFFLGSDYSSQDWEKVTDILDVWFDSGSTHAFVLEERKGVSWPADLYLEGSDQHRGWFQSSLLEACATRDKAPYKSVFTHGFVVDEKGRKMSKSSGNVLSPITLSRQNGAEILRMWVASSDYTDDLRIGKEIIQSQLDSYRKLRNTIRYLIGALSGFSSEEKIEIHKMPSLEKWILHRLTELDEEVKKAYCELDIKRVYSLLMRFSVSDLSAFYFDIRKDSLYCDRPDSIRRRSCRTVFSYLFNILTHWLAPIFTFTMEEAWLCLYPDKNSIHLNDFQQIPSDWKDPDINKKWHYIRQLRRVVTGALEVERKNKTIGSSLEAKAKIYTDNPVYQTMLQGEDLSDILIVSQAEFIQSKPIGAVFKPDDINHIEVVIEKAKGKKCARSWRILEEVGKDPEYPDLSLRDADAVRYWDQTDKH